MQERTFIAIFVCLLVPVCFGGMVFAQQSAGSRADRAQPQDERPPRFFRESFKEPAGDKTCPDCNAKEQVFLTPAFVENPDLELKQYGPGSTEVMINHHPVPKDDPTYLWTGMTTANWAITLRHKTSYVDLSNPVAKIRWRVLISGWHQLRPVLKLADGTFLVGDKTEGETLDWHENEIAIGDIHWRILDPATVFLKPGAPWKDHPDLTKVDEVGFTDLNRGYGHGSGGMSRIDWIEVYGVAKSRNSPR
jgi:hypothetical protein